MPGSSALTNIITEITSRIPKPILQAAFLQDTPTKTIDQAIIDEVIKKRLLLSVNLVCGRLAKIPLKNSWVSNMKDANFDLYAADLYNSTYLHIPPHAREHRNINSVVRVTSGIGTPGIPNFGNISGWFAGGNSISSLANAMVGSHTLQGAGWVPVVTLEQNNYIRILGTYPETYLGGLILECTLEWDHEFINNDTNFTFHLCELAVCATKAYIYNKLVIEVGETQISAGMEIGVFKNILDSYMNENDRYNELLMNVRGGQTMDINTALSFIYKAL